ncbi:hypothetical protein [Streptomyces bauhiniae]|uniref:hypothetical protein n=1 Tax=Streptomyces bauhiniae TaxID=2340725 RepID=UPI00380DF6B1
MTYPAAERHEAARLAAVAREVFTGEDAAVIVLWGRCASSWASWTRHAHNGVVTVAALLRAAGAPRHEYGRGPRPARAAPPTSA